MVRSCCILAPDGRFQCAYPKCPKLYASQDAVRKHCRLQHLEWLRNLQTTTSKNQQQNTNRSSESPRLQALRCLPPTEALDLLQPDDWLADLMDFDPSELSALPPPMSAPPPLAKESSAGGASDVEQLDEQAVQACIRQLNTAIRRCPSTAQSSHMLKIVRLLSLTPVQLAQLQPRERRTVLGIRRSSIQKMQEANAMRSSAGKVDSLQLEADAPKQAGTDTTAPPGRSPSLRPRSSSFDGKGRMPPASFFGSSKQQKTAAGSSASGSGTNSSPDI